MTPVFVEPRPKGKNEGDPITGYVVETAGDQILHETATQADAIAWAKKHSYAPHVARVRHLNDKKIPNHWRAV